MDQQEESFWRMLQQAQDEWEVVDPSEEAESVKLPLIITVFLIALALLGFLIVQHVFHL